MNEKSNGKMDITFELRTVKNLKRNGTIHMYGTIHVYGTVYVTIHDTVHINGSMM